MLEVSSKAGVLSESQATTPRELALEILARVDQGAAYADILLDAYLQKNPLGDPDRRLLTQVVYGTLRWRGRIDWVLGQLLERPLAKLEPLVRNLLRFAAYELLFLDRVPAYAAVNEAVKLARKHAGKGKVGLVNAILREITRRSRSAWTPDHTSAEQVAAFGSHPPWLVEMWRKQLGDEETIHLMEANNTEAPLVLRVNRARISRDQLIERLRSHGIGAEPGVWSPQAIRLKQASGIAALAEFREGLCQVQGEASQLVSFLLDVQPGTRLLDVCAAPGGKATHLAELLGDRGEVIATDISARGLEKLHDNASRLGLESIRAYESDASRGLPEAPASFDRVLVDAPCSGLGTLRSHPEIKWRRSGRDIRRLSRLQRKILGHTAPLLKPAGILVYATCTLSAAENERVVESFLSINENFRLGEAGSYLPGSARHMVSGPYFQALPHEHDTDGFFAAVLLRSG